jgi:UrcA family protein
MSSVRFALAAGAALFVAAFGSQAEARAVKIKFDAADAASSQGAVVLLERIETAARRVCRESGVYGVMAPRSARMACVADTVNAAVAKLNLPELTRYAAEKSSIGPVAALEGVKVQ